MRIPEHARRHVLALDLATSVGWCAGAFGQTPRCGTVQLRGDTPVERCAALRDWLDDFEAVQGRVTALVLESAIVGQHNALPAVELLFGLRAVALLWAYDGAAEGAPVLTASYASSSVRAHMLGTARWPKGEAKRAVVAWCERRGLRPSSPDAADAAITWSYAEALALGTPPAPRPGLLNDGARPR